MTWVDQTSNYGFGAILTSTQMQNMRDNFTGLANGDTGAPKAQMPFLTDVPYGRQLLKTIDLSSVTSAYIPIIGLMNSSFDLYEFKFISMQVESSNSANTTMLEFEYSSDSGATWDSSATYITALTVAGASSVTRGSSGTNTNGMLFYIGQGYNVDSSAKGSGEFSIYDPLGTGHKISKGSGMSKLSTTPYDTISTTLYRSASAVNAIRFFSDLDVSSLYFRSGKVCVYGTSTNSF